LSVAARFALDGRVALVTGGSRGIGRAIATALAEAGATVAINARHAEACEEAVAEIVAAGGAALAVPGHAGDAAACEAIVAEVMRQTGRLDVLVNNAATNPQFGPILDADEGAINKIWDVNVLGPLRLTRHAVAAWMRDHGGSVINMSSVAGIRPEPLTGAYNTSKAALITLTRTLARELGSLGIRVNAIAPGLVETKLARYLVETTDVHDHIIGQTALGRHAVPDEIAGAALFLASDAASFVTGSVLVVDGGWSA
jgi:NAD(P)-dependent dehydrogenase (short-subunit alcohol dehydrogenase family)